MRPLVPLASLLFLAPLAMWAEGLLSQQSGTPIPANAWTQLAPAGYSPDYVTGYDKWQYVPAIDRACIPANYREPSSEPNRAWSCYSFAENRWDVWDIGSSWHNEHMPEGGHPVGAFNVDPSSSLAHYPCCFSGSQVSEGPKWGMYWYDFTGQVGRTKQTAVGLRYYTVLSTGTFDPFTGAGGTLVLHGGDSGTQGTSHYTPNTNAWEIKVTTSCSPSCPADGLDLASSSLNTGDKKIYLFGGISGSTVQDSLYRYLASTRTWEQLTPSCSPSCPSARFAAGFAYSPTDNLFLMHGGYGDAGRTIIYNDTWIYDPAANAWSQLAPSAVPATPTQPPYERLAYFQEDDVFVLVNVTTVPQIWAFRYRAGQNAGYRSIAYTAPTGLNRNSTGSPVTSPSWAYGGATAVSGSNVYQAWTETRGPNDTSDARLLHPYAQRSVSGAITHLGQSYDSMSPNIAGSPLQSFDLSLAVVGTTPWACWHQQNVSIIGKTWCKGWDGAAWSIGGEIGQVAAGAAFDGPVRVADISGTPSAIFREQDRSVGILPWPTYAYVKQWTGSAFQLLGGALNSGATHADSVAIASDGTANPYVAWTEYGSSNVANPPSTSFTNPKAYLAKWSGAAWQTQCGGSANVTGTNRAYDVSVAYMEGNPYIAFVERSDSGNQKLYVRKCSGGAWSTVGGVYLNRDQTHGWAFRPELTADGTNLYVAWAEQGNAAYWVPQSSLGQRPQIHVAKWDGATWTKLGGSVNVDTAAGAATHPSIAVLAGNPVLLWGEVRAGSLRQMYAKQWDGSDWKAMSNVTEAGARAGGAIVLRGKTTLR